jgi:hypothetical protein
VRTPRDPIYAGHRYPRLADISTVDPAAKAMPDDEMQAEIEDFLEGFNQPTYRGIRIDGERVDTWSNQGAGAAYEAALPKLGK